MKLQKLAGLAALYSAASFIILFAVVATLFAPAELGPAATHAAERVAFMAAHREISMAVNLIGYIFFGAAMNILSFGLYERFRGGAPIASQIALGFGLIWSGLVFASGMVANIGLQLLSDLQANDPATASIVFHAYRLVVNGLGGGNEIVGGLWLLCIGFAMKGRPDIPAIAAWLTMLIGFSGIATTFPPLAELATLFGIGLIVWYLWIALTLLRRSTFVG